MFHKTPWTAARQTPLSSAVSRSLLRLMSIESVMPSNHLILCRPPPTSTGFQMWAVNSNCSWNTVLGKQNTHVGCVGPTGCQSANSSLSSSVWQGVAGAWSEAWPRGQIQGARYRWAAWQELAHWVKDEESAAWEGGRRLEIRRCSVGLKEGSFRAAGPGSCQSLVWAGFPCW